MKKVLLALPFLFFCSCQTIENPCDNFCKFLSTKIAVSYECEKPEVFYNYFKKICPQNNDIPQSIASRLGCKFGINFIVDNINSFSEEGSCKKDFISNETKEVLIETCSGLVP